MTTSQLCTPASEPGLSLVDRLADVAPVDLATLNSTASLQTRKDRKYLLSPVQAEALLDVCAPNMLVLDIAGRRSFDYESLYFDTPALDSFRGAAHRHRRRFKVRTRVYRDQGTCALEVKRAGVRGETVKSRLDHATRDRFDLTDAGAAFVDAETDRPGLSSALRPVLSTRYRRSTLVDPAEHCRITIDTELSVAGFDGGTRTLDGAIIVETKSAGRPTRVDRWLQQQGLRPLPISKFGVGMVLIDPRLPTNRWHRVLRSLG